VACIALALWCHIVSQANAQQLQRYFALGLTEQYLSQLGELPSVPVLTRPRPEYDPPVMRVGSFIVNLDLAQGVGYDSNAAGLPKPEGSLLLQTLGSAAVRSDWGRHSLRFNADTNIRRYPSQSQQSTTDWDAGVIGTYDVGRHQVNVDLSHVQGSVTPRDLGNPLVAQPAPFTVDSALTNIAFNLGSLSLIPGAQFSAWRYENGVQNGVPLSLSSENHDVLSALLIARYQPTISRSLLAVVRALGARYVTPPLGLPNLNYDGLDALAGLAYDEEIWRYRALVGYQFRRYATPAFGELSGPTAEVELVYQPTGLTTMTLSGFHTIVAARLANIPAYTLSQARLTVDHELRRNVLLQGRAEFDKASYPQNAGSGILINAGASVTWLVNNRLRVIASYDYSNRQTGPSSYVENITQVSLGVRF
jgi:hypothetical protein